jgi:hypothetical protein
MRPERFYEVDYFQKRKKIMPTGEDAPEGIELSPVNTTRLIAEAAARRVVIEHIGLCPFAGAQVESRLRNLESRFSLIIGLMLGSGMLGGVSGAIISKLLP